MKQTAVEWYDAQLKYIDFKLQSGLINYEQCKELMLEAFNQAKEMEKAQIIKAHGNKKNYTNQIYPEIITGEQYYNETYGKE